MNRLRVIGVSVFLIGCGAGGLIPAADRGGSPDAGPSDIADHLLDLRADEAFGDLPADPRVDAQDLADPGPADRGPDTPQPKGYVSARRTAVPLDMIGGDNAYGIRGKSFLLENDKVRFLIQDAGAAVHLGVYGGTLIDADLKRAPGEDGNDQFREMFPMVGFRVAKVGSVEVLKDGSDGQEAVVRVTGPDGPTGITKMIDDLGQPLGVTLHTDYILRPNVPYLLVRTTVENPNAQAIQDLAVGDFLSFGGASRVFTPEGGFRTDALDATAMLSTGRGASYGYTVVSGRITIPYSESNATIAILGTDFSVPAKGSASFDRAFIVGRGDVASVLAVVHELRGEEVVEVSGKVLDEGGQPVQGATVTAFKAGEAHLGGGPALNQAITDAQGRYLLTLPRGSYDLVASAEGRRRVVREAVDVTLVAPDFQMGAAGSVGLDIQERDSGGHSLGHIPAKVSLYCLEGAEPPWPELGERERYGLCAVLFQTHGQEQFPVKPGRYRAVLSRGIEYEVETIPEIEIQAGKTVWVEKSLFRSVDTTGFLAADFHQHTFGSIDSELSHTEKVIENLAEGVEIAAITDHDNLTSYRPAILALGVEDWITSVDGDEVSASGRGHFNIFEPTGTHEDLDPFRGAQLYAFRTIPELFEAIRAIPGVRAIQVNHPRDGLDAYFSFSRYDPVTGVSYGTQEPMAWDFDVVEVKGSLGTPEMFLPEADEDISKQAAWGSQDIPVMRDWFSMLNQGKALCATGVSDAHNRNDGVGYSRTYLAVGTDDPAKVSTSEILDAVLAQRAVVSNGPFIRVTAGDRFPLGHTDLVTPSPDGTLVLDVQVLAASWIPVTRLELYANGRPVRLQEVAGTLIEIENPKASDPLFAPIPLPNTSPTAVERLHTTIQLFPKRDTWYVLVVRAEGDLAPVGDGSPFAYTNPIYVDVDGGGFEAPGL